MNTSKSNHKRRDNKFIYAIGFFCFLSIASGELTKNTPQDSKDAYEITLHVSSSNSYTYYFTSKI